MNDFDYENLQKKRVARGAFAHVSRKRGKCRLPSDFLTPAQRKKKNGEVKTYNIMRPMPIADFNGMAEDLQREYIRNMQGFGATAAWLAPRMGCSANMARNRAERLGVPFRRGGGDAVLWAKKCAEWDAVSVPETAPEAEPEPQETKQCATGAALLHARLVVHGDRASILASLGAMMPEMCEVTVEW